MKPDFVTEWLRTALEGLKLKKRLMAYADAFSYNPSLCRRLLEMELLSQFPQLKTNDLETIVDAIIKESRKPEEVLK